MDRYQAVYDGLCTLYGCYEELLGLAREKQAVLKAKDNPEALTAITQKESRIMESAREAERVRMDDIAAIEKEASLPAGSLDLETLAARAEAPMGRALREKGSALSALLRELQSENEINRQLLEVNLSFASFMLDLISSEQGPSSIYGATGGEAEDAGERISRLLDSEV